MEAQILNLDPADGSPEGFIEGFGGIREIYIDATVSAEESEEFIEGFKEIREIFWGIRQIYVDATVSAEESEKSSVGWERFITIGPPIPGQGKGKQRHKT